MAFLSTSRYHRTVQSTDPDGKKFVELLPLAESPEEVGDSVRHEVDIGDVSRLDLIAHRYLGDVHLWWVVADFNEDQIMNPLRDMETGMFLTVPSASVVEHQILGR